MKRLLVAFSTVAASTALLAVTADAQAQLWLRDRSGTQGSGIRSGDVEFHPGVAAEVGYDSNFFNRSSKDTSIRPVIDTVLPLADLEVGLKRLEAREVFGKIVITF